MPAAIDKARNSYSINNFTDPQILREKTLKPLENKLDSIKDKIEVNEQKINALSHFKGLNTSLYKATKALTADLVAGNAFNQLEADGTSTVGNASDYLNVDVQVGAIKAAHTVSIQQIATAASFISHEFANNHFIGFGEGGNIQFNITGLGAGNVDVILDEGDNLATIAQKLNSALSASNITVALIDKGNGHSVFSIRSTITGERGIACTTNDFFGTAAILNPVDPTQNYTKTDGINANITFDGIAGISSNSNTIQISGLTLTLKQNGGGSIQTFNIKEDPKKADNSIKAWMQSVNDIFTEIAHQKEKVARHEHQKEKNSKVFTDTAYLRNSFSLNDIERTLRDTITATVTGLNDGVGNIKSLSSMCIDLVLVAADKDNPERRQLEITQAEQNGSIDYVNALNANFEKVRDLFSTQVRINPVIGAGNGPSYVGYVKQDKSLRLSAGQEQMLGQDIALSVNVGAAGTVTGVQYTYAGQAQNAAYDPKSNTITFEGTDLDGLVLSFAANGVANHIEQFTLNVTEGLADTLALRLTQFQKIRKENPIDIEIGDLYHEADKLELQRDRTEKSIAKKKQQLDLREFKLNQIAIMAEVSESLIHSMLGTKDSN